MSKPIDISGREDRALKGALVQARRHRPPAVIVVSTVPAGVVRVSGYMYLGDVPVTLDANVTPPPRPAPRSPSRFVLEPVADSLEMMKLQKFTAMSEDATAYIEGFIPSSDHARLLGVNSTIDEMMAQKLLDPGIVWLQAAIKATIQWGVKSMGLVAEVIDSVKLVKTVEELEAIEIDYPEFIGEPPVPRITPTQAAVLINMATLPQP